jgi:hypothetical protein
MVLCPVSGGVETTASGTAVVEAIISVSASARGRGGGSDLFNASLIGMGAVRSIVTPVTVCARSSAKSRHEW